MTPRLRPLALTAALLPAATACASRDVLGRASPDGRVEAVIVATSGGTPSAFGYEVHVVPAGREPAGPETRVARLVGAERGGGDTGATLVWASPGELRVEYLRAATAELRRPTLAIAGRVVHVSLDSGVVHAPTPGRRDDPLGDILVKYGAPRADGSLTAR